MTECVICKNEVELSGSRKTCGLECSEKLKKLTRKRYFEIPENHEKHLKVMREYMKRPDVMKREKIRKQSPKYKAWWKKYSQTDSYKKSQKKRQQKQKRQRSN